MTTRLHPTPTPRTNLGFHDLPVPRLERLRDRYQHLLLTDPTATAYSAAALSEIDAALTVARVKGGA